MKTVDFALLKALKGETDGIFLRADFSRHLDYNGRIFFRSELDTLLAICNIAELRAYKECFILLRTVFEKFLFFWLMLEGTRYRWTKRYYIHPEVSSTPKVARDAAMERWKVEKDKGNPSFRGVLTIDAGRADNVIVVTYELEVLQQKSESNKAGPTIPIYSYILEHYKPSLVHTPIEIPEGTVPKDVLKEQIEEQKMIHNQYFYIKTIFRNLRINNLITKDQLDKIKVHYSFLSECVHPGLASLDIWRNINPYDISPSHEYPEDILRELIFLYVAKLMQLYIKVFLTNFRKRNPDNQFSLPTYENITNKLDALTKELWFFDNEPTTYGIRHSDSAKRFRKHKQLTENGAKVIYYDNPAERLRNLRYFHP